MNPPVIGEYRDRKTGLVVFGVFEIIAGAFLWLMVPLMAFVLMAPRRGMPPLPHVIPATMGFYGLAGTGLIWLGIGSILARRWARALWVCIAAIMFATGVLVLPSAGYVAVTGLPGNLAAQGGPVMPPAAVAAMQIFTLCFMAILYIIIPGILLLFYAGGNVRRTCEVRDPQRRWTDRCPLPVLALSLFTGFGAVVLLAAMPFFGVFPLFGIFAGGTGGRLLMLAYGVVMLYAAWGTYRLQRGAWWLMLTIMVLMAISGALTMWHANLQQLYLDLGFDERMAVQAGTVAQRMKWMGVVTTVPWLGWAFYVRRYFKPPAPAGG